MLTGEQIKAARALTRLEQAGLAQASGLSLPTIKRLEKMVGPISANTSTEAAIRRAFDGLGVIFLDADTLGVGVRLAARPPQ